MIFFDHKSQTMIFWGFLKYFDILFIIRKTKCSRSAKRNDIFAKRNVYVFSSL